MSGIYACIRILAAFIYYLFMVNGQTYNPIGRNDEPVSDIEIAINRYDGSNSNGCICPSPSLPLQIQQQPSASYLLPEDIQSAFLPSQLLSQQTYTESIPPGVNKPQYWHNSFKYAIEDLHNRKSDILEEDESPQITTTAPELETLRNRALSSESHL